MAHPIRVLHVIDKFAMDGVNPSSCSRLFAEWIPRHDKQRFQVDVAGLRARDAAGEFLERQGIKVYYITEGKFSPKNIARIARLAQDGGYDMLHLHGYSSANFGRLAARRLGIPSIVHEHAILKVLPHQYLIDRLLRHKTDVAVAVSGAVKQFMIHGRSVPAERIRVIWNGVRLNTFQRVDPEKAAAFRRALGIAEKSPLIGTVTRLREEKGNKFLIEAMAQVLTQHPDSQLVLIGDGPLREELTTQVERLGIAAKVKFAGFIAEVPPALAALDIVVIPSLQEGFGLALVEAMAAGKPVVATRVGGMVELAEDNVSALMVPPRDATALAQAINKLMDDADLAHRLGSRAAAESNKFSIEANVQALEKLYAEIAADKRFYKRRPIAAMS